MYVYLSKILPLFVLPLGIVFFLGLVGILLLKWDRQRIAIAVLALAGLVLWVSSMPATAHRLYTYVESQYPPQAVERIPASNCMVVMGGAIAPPLPPRVELEFVDSSDRIFKALQLYQAKKAEIIIISAGNQPWSDSPWTEAELIKDFLVERGVPPESVLLEGSSRNTRENALYSRNTINSIGCENPLLVTSAAHMARSVAAFLSVGVAVTPVSTDIRAVPRGQFVAMDYLPNANALAMTTEALRELLGRAVYGWQGWN